MADKSTFERYTEIPLDKMTAEQRKAYARPGRVPLDERPAESSSLK
jgi:hypothetical protein